MAMESKILYEIHYTIQWPLLIPVFFCIICSSLLVKIVKSSKKQGRNDDKTQVIFLVFALIFDLIIISIVLPDQVRMFDSTIGAYWRGEYLTVEGYVEDFHPMPWSGHDDESFTIDHVRFSYSDYTVSWGYHNARSHGGVITGNGQHLKIGYTSYQWLGNVILYIEELP